MEQLDGGVSYEAPPSSKSLSGFSSHTSSTGRPTVRFLQESNSGQGSSIRIAMAKQLFESFTGDDITDSMLAEAATLFSDHYGRWGNLSDKPGQPVKLSVRRLRDQYMPENAAVTYIRVTIDEKLAGHAFACRWKYKGQVVCWVTQLVVHEEYRDRGLASGLLRSLKADSDAIYGIMSSHPAACLAAATCFQSNIEKVPLDFIGEKASAVMQASPIQYIREAEVCGSLFNPDDRSGMVSGVNTGFFVDHVEPLEALKMVQETWDWPLGDLPDGHEFLVILSAQQRRSRSLSSSRPVKVAGSG